MARFCTSRGTIPRAFAVVVVGRGGGGGGGGGGVRKQVFKHACSSCLGAACRTTTGFEQAKVADAPGPLRLSVFLAAACIIVAVPAPTRCEEPPCLPRYLAIELQSGSDQLLASVALHGTHQNVQVRGLRPLLPFSAPWMKLRASPTQRSDAPIPCVFHRH